MILWSLYFVVSLVVSVICYVTNPIVLLFCDDDGELPSFLHYWQTWDNSCNPSDIVDIAPAWLQYDWEKHYTEHKDSDPYLWSVNRERWYTTCIDSDFTVAELLKRYACRVLWLMRNNAYGFGFYMLGLNVSPLIVTNESENTIYAREVFGRGMCGAWMYKNTAPIFSIGNYTVYWNNLLGWKIALGQTVDTRAMIANRIAFTIKKEG